ncbi:hypothetical protein LH704_34180 [Burkholderia cenocepacia]|nr:hypothetical protein [Burkholderia cenocepacia]MCF1370305.1 hypothetical protein [Burkholderia cenocepacia]MCF1389278.1 hypothetical protein [Burkholderia cenocepacia]
MRAAIRFTSTGIANAAHACASRDWLPLVALVVLYLIADAIAPAFGV